MNFYLDSTDFGRIIITARRDCRRLVARWKDRRLHLTVPQGTHKEEVLDFLERHHDSIARLAHPAIDYRLGQKFDCFRCHLILGEQTYDPARILFGHEGDDLYLNLPKGLDLDSDLARHNISAAMQMLMANKASSLLLPYAREVADGLGAKPQGFRVGRGLKKLGHCTRQGIIQFSRNVMFLPEELVHLIVCHELAHLSHFNHSLQFHALLNSYVDGHEKELEHRLKVFAWPIVV